MNTQNEQWKKASSFLVTLFLRVSIEFPSSSQCILLQIQMDVQAATRAVSVAVKMTKKKPLICIYVVVLAVEQICVPIL